MNQPLSIASASLLAILATTIAVPGRSQLPSPSPQSTASPQPTTSPQAAPIPVGSNVIGKLQCGSKATATGEISLRANGYYTAKDENGKYQAIDRGYRFLSGSLRGQSMVQYKKNIYLIDSKDEAKASVSIANNSPDLLACAKIERDR
jgi:hypothetical protein